MAMVIGAGPVSGVMGLMCFSLVFAIYSDGRREAAGVQTTFSSNNPMPAE
jgi:hypothetical protein